MPNLVVRILRSLGLALLCGCQLVDNTIRGRLLPSDPLSISTITDQEIIIGTSVSGVGFTVTNLPRGALGACGLSVKVRSSAANIVAASDVALTGELPNCGLTVTPSGGELGAATVTLRFSLRGKSAETSFLVTVLAQGSPLSPTGLTATPTATDKIQLAWTSGGGATVGYRISYAPSGSAPVDCASGVVIGESAITGTSHLIGGLLADTTYSFRVCGINGNPLPAVSAGTIVSATTWQDPPPDPSGFSGVAVVTGHVLLLWTSGGASTEGFRISYQAGGTPPSDCSSGEIVDETKILPSYHLVGPLASGAQYSFRICAINGNPTPDVSAGQTFTIAAATTKLSAVKDLATGDDSSCAIDFADRLWCWGKGGEGQLGDGLGSGTPIPVEVAGGSTWLSVSVDWQYGCAIRASDSQLLCWGSGGSGRRGDGTSNTVYSPVPVNLAQTFKMVDTSDNHACAIASNDTAYCWGAGGSGEVGSGGTGTFLNPTLVTGGHTWKTISTGASHTCGIRLMDSSIWCWGLGSSGQMGNNTTTTNNPTPVTISGGGSWKMVSAGWDHTCAIKSDDSLWCWGKGNLGQIGENNNVNRLVPTPVAGGGAWKFVEAFSTGNAACAIKMDDTLWCWGGNSASILGTGDHDTRYSPTQVFGGSSWKKVTASSRTICGIRSDDSVSCWGENLQSNGSRGLSNDLPLAFGYAADQWSKLGNSEGRHTCAIRSDQTLWCWGPNWNGELGDGTTTPHWTPGLVAGGATWAEVVSSYAFTCGIKTDGSLWCWGSGSNGKLGDGGTTDRHIPTPIAAGQTWKSLAATEQSACAIRSDDTVWCWGSPSYGQVGNGSSSGLPVVYPSQIAAPAAWKQVAAGWAHYCGISAADDSMWCWGHGQYGKLGNGSTADRTTPFQVPDPGPWKYVEGGEDVTCGIKSNDSLWCWGRGADGQLGIASSADASAPTQVLPGSQWKLVRIGRWHTCGLQMDDTAYCWGRAQYNQLGVNTWAARLELSPLAVYGGRSWKQLDLCVSWSCGIDSQDKLLCWGEMDNAISTPQRLYY